ncbi:MAG: hypothetical protein MJE77_24375 [Proteobacteria bacterium]|nr:hypothetical protein [Pseudomonadota bacterium]
MRMVNRSYWALCIIFLLSLLASACGGGDGGNAEPDSGATPEVDAPTPVDNACRHVDLLFSIDASSSMTDEIKALSDVVFPGLTTELNDFINRGAIEDYRIGVIDACPSPASLHSMGVDPMMGNAAKDCSFSTDKPWMDSSSPNLAAEFSCVTNMYTGDQSDLCEDDVMRWDNDERPAYAAATALSDEYLGSGGANEGFLRENALLVIVAITDEDEEVGNHVPDKTANADQIYDKLIAAKGNNPKKMVLVGVAGATVTMNDLPLGPRCHDGEYGEALQAIILKELTGKFVDQDRGVFWDLCKGQLENAVTQAIAVIEAGCNIVR